MSLRVWLFILIFNPSILMAAENPLKFSEEVDFLSKKEKPLLDLNKTDDFIGILTRQNIEPGVNSFLDLYRFNDSQIKKMDNKNCQIFTQRVFGNLETISLKILSSETFGSPRNGTICEVVVQDPDIDAPLKERRLFIFISKEKVYGMVGRFAKPANATQAEDMRSFVKGLRQP